MSHFEPTLASLREHEVPAWFDDAKLGIFIHWGLFSVPGFAADQHHISDAFTHDYDRAVVMTPYTEWYDNALRVPGSPTALHHAEHYGDAPYADFRAPFAAGLEHWDPDEWAALFERAGAGYVVLVTKHHDGYCLWPSQVENTNRAGWCSERDVVGELAAAVRRRGLRFGVYYSGGIDWSFAPRPVRTLGEFVGSSPTGQYPGYADAQVRELIERYEPSVLWNDICWPTDLDPMLRLMADYYEAVPEGVVNDRWMHRSWAMRLIAKRPVQRVVDALLSRKIRRDAAAGKESKGIVPPRPAHCDFRTPEYTSFDAITEHKWEATRGMSASFGYNRNHVEVDYEPGDELLRSFIDTVSKNGNLLLNVGPRGEDASIPEPQVRRLESLGAWLGRNGDAIHGTRPFTRAEAEASDGTPVRFTRCGDTINVILLGTPTRSEIFISDLTAPPGTQIRYMGDESWSGGRLANGGLYLQVGDSLGDEPAHAFSLEPGGHVAGRD